MLNCAIYDVFVLFIEKFINSALSIIIFDILSIVTKSEQ